MSSSARLLSLTLLVLASCAPVEPPVTESADWLGGEPADCPVTQRDGSVTPDTSRDPGHGLAPVDGGECAEGAELHPQLNPLCEDFVGACFCRWICQPECGLNEVCNEDGTCACHASYTPGPNGCTWDGLHDNGAFDSCEGWSFEVGPGNADTPPIADVQGGRLHLGLTHPCTTATASTTVRLPARSELPGGAALVFEYTASDTVHGDEPRPGVFVHLFNRFFSPPPADEARTHRECVRLDEIPRLTGLAFHMERLGACFPEELTDWHFRVDNVRLEAAPECGGG